MGKKQKRRRVLQGRPEYPREVVKEVGILQIHRKEALIRQIDTAIWLWFMEQEPLSIHLIAMAAFNCLKDLGFTPLPPEELPAIKLYTAYDFLRHSSKDPAEGLDFVPSMNESILFAVIVAFHEAFGGRTVYMQIFDAYYPIVLWRDIRNVPGAREFAEKLLPKGLTVEKAEALGRIGFFNKFAKIFAAGGGALASSYGSRLHLP
jgi:hypothetical protein